MNEIKDILGFLKELKANNYREWMQEEKARYQKIRESFMGIVQNTADGLAIFDKRLEGLEAKDCVFRINRDIRFSKDKTLYKTHFGAYMAPGGRKSMLPGYYLHLEPGNNSMIAAGLYRPGSALLTKVRQEIDYNAKEFLAIVENKAWVEEYGTLEGERLARAPKGYATDHQLLEYLQLKSYMAIKRLEDRSVTNKGFSQDHLYHFKKMSPLVNFLAIAIS